MSTMFSWQRFLRVFSNDVLAHSRRVLLGSAAIFALGTLLTLLNARDIQDFAQELNLPGFALVLLLGGALLTSAIFADLHHPLEKYHALMLPVSAPERFLSRWLVSGPVFYLFTVVLFTIFQWFTRILIQIVYDLDSNTLPLDAPEFGNVTLLFFLGHAVMLLGAIWFRSFNLAKTLLSFFLFSLLCPVIFFVALKLVYWDRFVSPLSFDTSQPLELNSPLFDLPGWVGWTLLLLAYLWVVFMAYTSLQDHEV